MAGASNLEEVACSAAKQPRRFRMAEYEVTKMEGVDEDPEISFKVRVPQMLSFFNLVKVSRLRWFTFPTLRSAHRTRPPPLRRRRRRRRRGGRGRESPTSRLILCPSF